RRPTAGVSQCTRRGGDCRPRRPAAAMGSRRTRLPARSRGPAGRGSPGPGGAPAARSGDRPARRPRRGRGAGPRGGRGGALAGRGGEPAEVEGTSGSWVVDPTAVGREFEGRTALLSPFDRLVHDRVRARDLFDFEYTLEMYKPAHQRRWGYFALPVLHDDRLVGKVDAIADRKVSRLLVHAIHEDVRFTHAMTKAVHAELEELASWLGLGAVGRECG